MARKSRKSTQPVDLQQVNQAHAISRLIMMADELPHQMAEDMNSAASAVADLLGEALEQYPGQSELEDAHALAGIIVAANCGDSMRDEIARSAAVLSRLIDKAIEELEQEVA